MMDEFKIPVFVAFIAVLTVILIITADIVATLIVALSVLLTDLFVMALIYFWNLTLNPLVLMQIVLGIGCSVDYSAHIAYAYLVEEVPKNKMR